MGLDGSKKADVSVNCFLDLTTRIEADVSNRTLDLGDRSFEDAIVVVFLGLTDEVAIDSCNRMITELRKVRDSLSGRRLTSLHGGMSAVAPIERGDESS